MGQVLWAVDGVPICTENDAQNHVRIISDGDGGAIISWNDYRSASFDVYAQRIDPYGNTLWTPGGVPVCTENIHQWSPEIVSDGAGGAIIVWEDSRFWSTSGYDIYARRVDANGSLLWDAGGTKVCAEPEDQVGAAITSDGAGGAIITWADFRGGSEYHVYAQRMNAAGDTLWPAGGEVICAQPVDEEETVICGDVGGGAVIAWVDMRNMAASAKNIYAQRIDAWGTVAWATNGEAICTAAGDQYIPDIARDGVSGMYIVWQDMRSGPYYIYGQHVDFLGADQWATNGLGINTSGSRYEPRVISDGTDGAIVTWHYSNVHAQRIDAGGGQIWGADGVALSEKGSADAAAATDGNGGFVFAWRDYRTNFGDIYAQGVGGHGNWDPAPRVHSANDVPDDQGGWLNLTWDASRFDPIPSVDITEYTIWRALDDAAVAALLAERSAPKSDAPVIRVEEASTATYYWELIDSHPAFRREGYSRVIPTLFDSTSTSFEHHYLQVIAHTPDPYVFWESQIDSGYSVDNLAPAQPQGLAGDQVASPEGLTLSWLPNAELDLGSYGIYRGLSADFTPGPGNLIVSLSDTTVFDDEWRWNSGYYYKVSALDIHGNESPHALLEPADVTGLGGSEPPSVTYLSQNFPNPFNPSTTIAFGLEAEGNVSLRVYDVSGKLVRVIVEGKRSDQHYREVWDGKDESGVAVASGVYFYRLTAGNYTHTRKMVLLR
jgi:hypothetical protein